MKKLLIALSLLFSSVSFAALDQDDVINAMAGQWSMSLEGEQIKFLVRSTGEISIISRNHDYVTATLSFAGSNVDWQINGLPVAHIIITEGSDEDVRDVHFLVTAIEYDEEISLKKLAVFSTFNDGPNDFSDVDSWSNFKKYDPKTKKWLEVK
ncbi:MAG: hypothetical protein CME71_04395 [Halobacteriovorax sp.]|nr:hypothetical protein [Halobacteriovorax sp.]